MTRDTTSSAHSRRAESFISCNFREFWSNSLLILTQCPQATRVAGYRTWQTLGRQVRRGERGLAILAPVVVRQRREHEPSDTATDGRDPEDREARRVLRGFRVAHVWDVSATDVAELPYVAPVALVGAAPEALF